MYRNVYKTLARGRYPPVNNQIIRMCIHQASGNISEDDCISRHYFCDKSLDCFKIFITNYDAACFQQWMCDSALY